MKQQTSSSAVKRRSHVSQPTMTANFSQELEGRRGAGALYNQNKPEHLTGETLVIGFLTVYSHFTPF